MSQMRGLPPIAGATIWARQTERQLLTYMKRPEDVLGKGWELYAEGQKLRSESAAFRSELDTRQVFEAWLHDINRRDMGVTGRLFEIVRLRGSGFQLAVNFDPQIITLFKDVRNLLWLGHRMARGGIPERGAADGYERSVGVRLSGRSCLLRSVM